MSRNVLTDPATGFSYSWPVNHSAVEKAERTRTITELPPTAAGWQDARPTFQQGDRTPEVLRLTGRVWDPTQISVLLAFLRASKRRTVIFEECSGDRYEVLIDSLEPQRRGVVRAPNGGKYVWDVAIEMEVVLQL
jgi:hypothetical protein